MKNKTYRKTVQLLSIALFSSAMTLPVYGGKLSDLFNPEDPMIGAIGVKILSSLDDPSLGQSAQVNHDWNHMVQHTRHSENPFVYGLAPPLIRPQRELTNNILASLKARPDFFSSLIQEIRSPSFTAALSALPQQQQNEMKRKLPNLLDSSLSLYPWHLLRDLEEIRDEKALTSEHKSFRRLNEVIAILQKAASSFPTLSSQLESLGLTYQDYIENLCALSSSERAHLLSPVILAGDFLKSSYLVSRSVAYQLLALCSLPDYVALRTEYVRKV